MVAALFSHHEDCGERGCAAGCGMLTYERLLEAPTVWAFDQRLESDFERRRAALLRGEVSA